MNSRPLSEMNLPGQHTFGDPPVCPAFSSDPPPVHGSHASPENCVVGAGNLLHWTTAPPRYRDGQTQEFIPASAHELKQAVLAVENLKHDRAVDTALIRQMSQWIKHLETQLHNLQAQLAQLQFNAAPRPWPQPGPFEFYPNFPRIVAQQAPGTAVIAGQCVDIERRSGQADCGC